MALRLGGPAGAVAGLMAIGAIGWGGYTAQSTFQWLLKVDRALAASNLRHESNTDAKSDRLPVARSGFQLASLQPRVIAASFAPVRSAPLLFAPSEPATPAAEAAPLPETTEAITAPSVVAAPAPQETAKPAPAPARQEAARQEITRHEPVRQAEKPKPPKPSSMLDDASIASIKTRLRLTADQEGYWPAVEAALRDIARNQLARRKDASQIDVNSPEVQRLTWAAMPLLMRMREDQKREVRTLARVIGLEAVASQI